MSVPIEELRSVVHFLWLESNENQDIYRRLCAVYGDNIITLRTVQKWTKKMNEHTFSIFEQKKTGRPRRSDLDQKITNFILSYPYASTKKIAKNVGADPKTVKNIMINILGMKKVNFKWIPHKLTPEIKAIRAAIASELFEFLSSSNDYRLRHILTQDETWIYFVNGRNSMWIESGVQKPYKPKQTIASKKVMISVIWSITGIKSITMLPIGQKFNRIFFSEVVLGDLAKRISTKGYFLHMDNARPHLVHEKLNELGIKRLPQPPFSPDLAPSDFFLFGYLKKMLEGEEFENEDQLFQKVETLLYNIPKDTFRAVYNEWMNRLLITIETQGEYIS